MAHLVEQVLRCLGAIHVALWKTLILQHLIPRNGRPDEPATHTFRVLLWTYHPLGAGTPLRPGEPYRESDQRYDRIMSEATIQTAITSPMRRQLLSHSQSRRSRRLM